MNICVFCGANNGIKRKYLENAYAIGQWIAKCKYTLIYGGASCGLMGEVAKGCNNNKGQVIGVLPHKLIMTEKVNYNSNELIKTNSLAERKEKMIELSDAFIILPGGFGTLDELSELLVLKATFKVINKKIIIYNLDNYFDYLVKWYNYAQKVGFISENKRWYSLVNSIEELVLNLKQLAN